MPDSLVDGSSCITGFKISGFTGNLVHSGFDERNTHTIVIELVNGTEIMSDIPGPILLNRPFKWEFSPGETCVGLNDITRVYLKAGGNDGWYIREVYTYCKVEENGLYIPLTAEPTFYKWLDGNNFDLQHHEVLPLNHSFIVGSVGLIGLGGKCVINHVNVLHTELLVQTAQDAYTLWIKGVDKGGAGGASAPPPF